MTDSKLHIQEWYDLKQTIAKLTKKCDKYKKNAEKVMRDKNVNSLSEDGFIVERKIQQSTRMIKKMFLLIFGMNTQLLAGIILFTLKKLKNKIIILNKR